MPSRPIALLALALFFLSALAAPVLADTLALPASTTPQTIASWVVTEEAFGQPTTYGPHRPDLETFLMVGDDVAWQLHGNWASVAQSVSRRLDAAWAAGDLRGDRILPGRRDSNYVIDCGERPLLTVAPDLAEAQGMKTARLTLSLIDDLRTALGGAPFARQVSRGGLLGVRPKKGMASWYGPYFNGRTAADGRPFDETDFTVASKTLPLGTLLLLINPANKRSALVRVTDRGPYVKGRVLDLSERTAEVLGTKQQGVAEIRYYVLPSVPQEVEAFR